MRGAANIVLLAAVAATVLGTGMGIGAGLATRSDDDAPNAGAVATVGYVACPGDQPIGVLRTSDRVFVVARDETGEWLEIRDPRNLTQRVWVPADAVRADHNVTALNVAVCTTVVTLPTTSTSTTTVPPSTTTSASSSTTTTTGLSTTTTTPVTAPPTTATPTTPAPTTPAPPTTPVPTTAAPDTSTPPT